MTVCTYCKVPVPRGREGCGNCGAPAPIVADRRDEYEIINGRGEIVGIVPRKPSPSNKVLR